MYYKNDRGSNNIQTGARQLPSAGWPAELTIRHALAAEWDAIDRLAQRDSAPPPPRTEMLVGEVSGNLHAAVSVRGDYAVADPFRRTVELLELLRARAAQLRGDPPTRRRPAFGFGRLPLPARR